MLLASLANASFCRLFNGDGISMLIVFIATLCGYLLKQIMLEDKADLRFVFFCCAFLSSVIGAAGYVFNLGNTPDIAHYKPMVELMDMLEKHEVDFVLAFKPTQRYACIESHILFNNHLAAIVHKNHPLAQKEKVRLTEIEKYDIALPARGLQARNAFEQVMSRYSPHFRIRVELNEVHILLKLIKQSELVTILSEATIHDEQGVKAIPIDVPENEMEGCVHMLKDVYRKHSAQAFIRMLSESNAIRERIHDWLR